MAMSVNRVVKTETLLDLIDAVQAVRKFVADETGLPMTYFRVSNSITNSPYAFAQGVRKEKATFWIGSNSGCRATMLKDFPEAQWTLGSVGLPVEELDAVPIGKVVMLPPIMRGDLHSGGSYRAVRVPFSIGPWIGQLYIPFDTDFNAGMALERLRGGSVPMRELAT